MIADRRAPGIAPPMGGLVKRLTIGCLTVFIAGLLGLATEVYIRYYAVRRIPNVLVVHIARNNWSSVQFQSPNLRGEDVVCKCCGNPELRDISHGPYTIGVQFTDHADLWVTYFHMNAGGRRRVDLFVTRTGELAEVRCVATEWHSIVSKKQVVITRILRLKDTSPTKPFDLDWM